MTTYIANPYVVEPPLTYKGGRLGLWARARRGVWALITDGEVTTTESPTTDEVEAADTALRGGYPTEITSEVATILTDAGYSSWVTTVA